MMMMITTLILCDWMKWFIFDAPVKWSFMIVAIQGITATKTCIWATSQACPLRRSHLDDVYGNMMKYGSRASQKKAAMGFWKIYGLSCDVIVSTFLWWL